MKNKLIMALWSIPIFVNMLLCIKSEPNEMCVSSINSTHILHIYVGFTITVRESVIYIRQKLGVMNSVVAVLQK